MASKRGAVAVKIQKGDGYCTSTMDLAILTMVGGRSDRHAGLSSSAKTALPDDDTHRLLRVGFHPLPSGTVRYYARSDGIQEEKEGERATYRRHHGTPVHS